MPGVSGIGSWYLEAGITEISVVVGVDPEIIVVVKTHEVVVPIGTSGESPPFSG